MIGGHGSRWSQATTTLSSLWRWSAAPRFLRRGYVAVLPSTLAANDPQLLNAEQRLQMKYAAWVANPRKQPPMDLLMDSSGNEVFSPNVDPSFCIQGGALSSNALFPDEIQRAVDEHVYWACEHPYQIPRKRNLVQHYRLDSRESLSASKKKVLCKHLVVTPFVLMGAYQRLLRRAQLYPYGESDDNDPQGRNIRNANLSFESFQIMSRAVMQMGRKPIFSKEMEGTTDLHADIQFLIAKEAMAMVMQPVVGPFLSPHSWFRQCIAEEAIHSNRNTAEADSHTVTTNAWKSLRRKDSADRLAHVTRMARDEVSYSPHHDGHTLLFWDTLAGGKGGSGQGQFHFSKSHVNQLSNMTNPYVSPWWGRNLENLFHRHGVGSKRKKQWPLMDDRYTSLPALLIDLFFLRLDYSPVLQKNRLFLAYQKARQEDPAGTHRDGVGTISEEDKLPKELRAALTQQLNGLEDLQEVEQLEGLENLAGFNDFPYVHMNYHRYGPTICLSFKGPAEGVEKARRAVTMELKSSLQLDARMVEDHGFSKWRGGPSKKPRISEAEIEQTETRRRVRILKKFMIKELGPRLKE